MVRIPLQEGILDIWQDEFTLTELGKALKTVKRNILSQRSHPSKMFQNLGPNTKMAVLDLFNMCWTKSIWHGELQRQFSSKKLMRARMTLHQAFDTYQ